MRCYPVALTSPSTALLANTNDIINEATTFGLTGVSPDIPTTSIGSHMDKYPSTTPCSRGSGILGWHELLEMIVKGDLDPTAMVTHRFGLSDVDKVDLLFDKPDEKDANQNVAILRSGRSGNPRVGYILDRTR